MVVREFHSGNAEFTSGLEILRLINGMEPSLMRREMGSLMHECCQKIEQALEKRNLKYLFITIKLSTTTTKTD